MSEPDGQGETLSLEALERIDRLCLGFEAAWKKGERPRIEKCLGGSKGQERSQLLRELILLELDYRRNRGEKPRRAEYLERFPESAELIGGIAFEGPDSHPERIGPYRILQVLGEGGMGVVYRARHLELGHEVALKVLATSSREALSRFVREAKVAAGLEHPNIVRLHDYGRAPPSGAFYTMDLIRGETYAAVLKRELPSSRDAARVLRSLAEAVDYAHAKGIIHRDLKPQNILIDSTGAPLVTDFGLAKNLKDRASVEITQSGMVMGTLSYMPPEQVMGDVRKVDTRSDVYALGAILYHSLTGRPPLVADSQLDLMVKITATDPIPLLLLNPAVPSELRDICHKCLEKSPVRRYQTAGEFAADLEAFLSHRPIRARAPSVLRRSWRYAQRNRVLLLGACAVIVALSIGLLLALQQWKRARELRVQADRKTENLRSTLVKIQALEGIVGQADGTVELLSGRLRERDGALETATGNVEKAEAAARQTGAIAEGVEGRVETLKGQIGVLEEEKEKIAKEKERANAQARLVADQAARERDKAMATLEAAKSAYLGRMEAVRDARLLEEYRGEAEGPWPTLPEKISAMEAWLAKVEELRERRDDHRRALSALGEYRKLAGEGEKDGIHARLKEGLAEAEGRFPERLLWHHDPEELRWQEEMLGKLIADMEAFFHPGAGRGTVASVKTKLESSRSILRESTERNKKRWDRAIRSIADRKRCPWYQGLEMPPQVGLVPIGQDPRSHLWEFVDLSTGTSPRRGAGGRLAVTEETGLVFVLIPGGSFRMGTQRPSEDPDPNENPVRRINLEPFFLSKYEMTQGQWMRLSGENPSFYGPQTVAAGKRHDLRHPVESVSWRDCVEVLSRAGLVLPTEAQWEYAARGGTRTAWWTGDKVETLEGAANLDDRTLMNHGCPHAWDHEVSLDDGYAFHAPVGSFRANPFGLHDVAGNVWEFCRDPYGSYEKPVREGDGERLDVASILRVVRGGCWVNTSSRCRSAERTTERTDRVDSYTGLRPARVISMRDPAGEPGDVGPWETVEVRTLPGDADWATTGDFFRRFERNGVPHITTNAKNKGDDKGVAHLGFSAGEGGGQLSFTVHGGNSEVLLIVEEKPPPESIPDAVVLYYRLLWGNYGPVVASVVGPRSDSVDVPVRWGLDRHRGRNLRLFVVDKEEGPWGHISVSQFTITTKRRK